MFCTIPGDKIMLFCKSCTKLHSTVFSVTLKSVSLTLQVTILNFERLERTLKFVNYLFSRVVTHEFTHLLGQRNNDEATEWYIRT